MHNSVWVMSPALILPSPVGSPGQLVVALGQETADAEGETVATKAIAATTRIKIATAIKRRLLDKYAMALLTDKKIILPDPAFVNPQKVILHRQ